MYLVYKTTKDEKGVPSFQFLFPWGNRKTDLDVDAFCRIMNSMPLQENTTIEYIYSGNQDFMFNGTKWEIYVIYKVEDNKIKRIVKVSDANLDDVVDILNTEKTESKIRYYGTWVIGTLE